jgi:6-phospho-beta-glucosidase
MKLALIGGGGVRAPEFVRGLLAFARDLDLQELWLMDNDAGRLALMTPLCEAVLSADGSPFRIIATTNLDDALRDAGMIVTTIRVGQEHGRVLDERLALRHNVLGQETTGAGGFSMAMRSIPALIDIAARAERLAPRAWTFNFTNPAGLVAQAMHEAHFRRTVGICDGANTAQSEIAAWMGVPVDSVRTVVYGLNHLSWTREARVNGVDVLPRALADDAFIQNTHLRFFGADLARRFGEFLNEYLYYFYFRDVAVRRIQEEEETRGEQIERMNAELFAQLRAAPPSQAMHLYEAYNRSRSASYMAYAEADEALREQRAHSNDPDAILGHAQEEVGGYAGVALRAGLALTQNKPLRIGLNVPNRGAIHGMADDDVVEVTCEVDGSGIHPVTIGDAPEANYLLMRSVKHYERLAAQAILNRSRELGVEALAAHPLIGSYPLAETLLDEYLQAHRPYVGEWH